MFVRWVLLHIFILAAVPSDSLFCYDCTCLPPVFPSCGCEELEVFDDTYCIIIRQTSMEVSYFQSTIIDRNSTRVHITDTYYILMQESIIYNETLNDWYTRPHETVFGCDWDLCNHPSMMEFLPETFQLSVDKTWLTENIYGTGSVTGCHHCPDGLCSNASNPFDYSQCPIQSCVNSSTCILYNWWMNIAINEECFWSECAPADVGNNFDGTNDSKYKLQIEVIVYLAQDRSKFDIWELDVFCGTDNCSRPTIFQEVKGLLSAELGDLTEFPLIRPITTTTPSPSTTWTPDLIIQTDDLSVFYTSDITTPQSPIDTTMSNLPSTTTHPFYDLNSCNDSSLIPGLNGSCTTINNANNEAVDFLLNATNTANATHVANALTVYFGTTATLNSSQLLNKTLTPVLVDTLVGLLNTSVTFNAPTSFIMARPTNESDIALGVSFQSGFGGQIITNSTETDIINSNFTAAAVISASSLIDTGVTYLSMLVIDKPPIEYRLLNDSDQKNLSSSIIVAKRQGNIESNFTNLNITIYLAVLPGFEHNTNDGVYYCSFYDANTSSWNESGCSRPIFNSKFQRYECSCNHLTSFALIWLPQTIALYGTKIFSAQDIISIVFQLISIICFLAIIIHSTINRLVNSPIQLEARDLLPLISCASTVLVFIFYIALGLTVYTQTESSEQDVCFRSASVLMFFVYFLLIFMFCTKTSVGYFNYLRFVYLFPQPSLKRLGILLITSLIISMACVTFAIGFNSNSSFPMTKLYPYKICWFTRHAIHYFLTIPISICLAMIFVIIFLVTKHMIKHIRNAESQDQSYKRMKLCVLILLTSCVTQSIGWLFGPLLTVINAKSANILNWFFIIVNALEGVWSILLYIILRQQRVDEDRRAVIIKELTKMTDPSSIPRKKR